MSWSLRTGQQPGLFIVAVYTVYKVVSQSRWRGGSSGAAVPVVPVFWVAEDDHDFAEANHTCS